MIESAAPRSVVSTGLGAAGAMARTAGLGCMTSGADIAGDVEAVAAPSPDGQTRATMVEMMHSLTIRAGEPVLKRDGDNDGLWTAMYVAAMAAKAHAAPTQAAAAEARSLAWKHFAAVEFLHNVTGAFARGRASSLSGVFRLLFVVVIVIFGTPLLKLAFEARWVNHRSLDHLVSFLLPLSLLFFHIRSQLVHLVS